MLRLRALSILAALLFALPLWACAQDGQSKTIIQAPAATLTLEIATNESTRSRGLMDRTGLSPHTGMLFVFPREGPVTFWMKNTLIPLDMIFVGEKGTVIAVAANVPSTTHETPDEKIPRRSAKAKYVIELPANEAAKDGIKPGVTLPIQSISAK